MTRTQIDWLRVFIEGAVIVGSILLAFGIDAWWDSRSDRQQEGEVLVGLRLEFESLASSLEGHARDARTRVHAFHRLLSDAEGVSDLTDDLSYLLSVPTMDPRTGSLNAVISSGRLELIQNRDLRERLARWGQVLSEVMDEQYLDMFFTYSTVVPQLASEDVSLFPLVMARAYATEGWPEDIPELPTPDDQATRYRALLVDPEVKSLIAVRYLWMGWKAGELDNAAAEARAIVGLLEKALAEF